MLCFICFSTIITIVVTPAQGQPPEGQQKACTIRMKRLDVPLILEIPNGNEHELNFLDLDENGIARVPEDQEVYVNCPGGTLNIKRGRTTQPTSDRIFKCIVNEEFAVSERPEVKINIDTLSCKITDETVNAVHQEVVKNTLEGDNRTPQCKSRGENTEEIQIGYRIETRFAVVYTVCFDEKPIYSKYKFKQTKCPPAEVSIPKFENSMTQFYENFNFEIMFSHDHQHANIFTPGAIPEKTFLNRGHLTPNAAFVYKFQRYATYDYVNVAPQWNRFNERNWGALERAIRMYAPEDHVIEVYTGTFDVFPLLNNEIVELRDDRQNTLEVSKWFWKITYDRTDGTFNYLFLSYNIIYDTYVEVEKKALEICQQQGDFNLIFKSNKHQIKAKREDRGIMFACNWNDVNSDYFKELIDSIKSTDNMP